MDYYFGKNKRAADLLKAVECETVKMRRRFHENPEVSLQEKHTSEFVLSKVKELGLAYETVGDYGVLALLEGSGEGKTVLLRADMDALPVEESTNNLKREKACVSRVSGVSHACGHDAHTAMLLSAMKVLAGLKDSFKGRVLFAFEQAEEIGKGVEGMLAALEPYQVDCCWGIHTYFELEEGKICVDPGPRMAGASVFSIRIKGQGGHVSRPDQCKNPIDAGVGIINTLNSVWATQVDCTKTVTLGIANFMAGQKSNVIPDDAVIAGSLRFFDKELGVGSYHRLKEIALKTAPLYGCSAVFERELVAPYIVYNNPSCSQVAKEAVGEVLGETVLESCQPWFASETMARYLEKYPGVFAFLGIRDEEYGSGAGHHTAQFDIKEDCLKIGVASTVNYALRMLCKLS